MFIITILFMLIIAIFMQPPPPEPTPIDDALDYYATGA